MDHHGASSVTTEPCFRQYVRHTCLFSLCVCALNLHLWTEDGVIFGLSRGRKREWLMGQQGRRVDVCLESGEKPSVLTICPSIHPYISSSIHQFLEFLPHAGQMSTAEDQHQTVSSLTEPTFCWTKEVERFSYIILIYLLLFLFFKQTSKSEVEKVGTS